MRAAVLHEHGTPPAYGEHPEPVAGEGWSLVRVTAAPVVPLDLLCASGTSYFGRRTTPYVPGVQGVGEVVGTGERVFFPTAAGMADGDGSLAELAVARTEELVPLGTALPDTAVAAIGLSGVAAWMALSWRAALQPGERVVVLGAGGAVGQAAVGAARALGAERVVAVCRPGPAEQRAAGADAVVPLPADRALLADRVRAALGGPADVVLDPVFGWVAEAVLPVLGPGGRLVNLGGAAGDGAALSSAALRGRSLSVLGYTNNSLTAAQRADALTRVLRVADDGLLEVAHEVRPLADVALAWDGVRPLRQVIVP